MARRPQVLVVDDDPAVTDYLAHKLKDEYEVSTASSAAGALELLVQKSIDLVLLDLCLGDQSNAGLGLLPKIKDIDSTIEVIVITAGYEPENAFDAGKRGAFDYVQKPIDDEQLTRLRLTGRKALEKRRMNRESMAYRKAAEEQHPHQILFESSAMQSVMRAVKEVAPTDTAVLITGETGVGKELVARAVHRLSRRAERPFVAVHLAAVPDNLLESDLFGHEKGAFTGAMNRRLGKFELADNGTLFFDEIGTMSPQVQVRLLRVLQEREIERIGGERMIPVDVRVISATNMDLQKAMDGGQFRTDLYYRLHTVPIHVPPLRERQEDIPVLAKAFLARFASRYGKKFSSLSPEAARSLSAYSWPGNVRELEHVVERIVSMHEGETVEERHLPLELGLHAGGTGSSNARLKSTLENAERQIIVEALSANAHNQSRTAETLGIDRTTLIYKMKKLGIRSSVQ
ncbi:MAG: sigma-54-dependent Fis family transcriptional regulator [Nitrospirae bacterium]|nr:sigma-54-dependent Fis family transcriptional regulator [Nitrospirota bacterium]